MGEVHTWQAALQAGERETGVGRLVELVLGALRQELEVLREDPDLLEIARSSTAANISVITDLAGGRLDLHDFDPPPQAVAFARELARRNLPVSDLARAYRVAQRALWHWGTSEIQQRVTDPVERAEAIEQLSHAAFATGDVFNATVMDRYAQERERWVRSADALRAETVAELLAGGPVDPERAGRRLRYELEQEHVGFVVWHESDAIHPEDAAVTIGGPGALVVPVEGGIVAGWSPSPRRGAALPSGVQAAFGEPARGVVGFRATHREAIQARRVTRLVNPSESTIEYREVAFLALLTNDLAQAERFARRLLGPLDDDTEQAQRLSLTLRTVLECGGSPRHAARRLGVHENTVAKRLRSVDELIGGSHTGAHTAELHAALVISAALREGRARSGMAVTGG